jgi:hypothetical protein
VALGSIGYIYIDKETYKMTEILRKCRECSLVAYTESDLALFRKRKTHKYGREQLCKKCDSKASAEYAEKNKQQRQNYYYTKNYGISLEEVNILLEEQNYRCAICGTDGEENLRGLHIDHSHKTGNVRGILCHKCNTALGLFQDDVDVMFKAIKYLGENT